MILLEDLQHAKVSEAARESAAKAERCPPGGVGELRRAGCLPSRKKSRGRPYQLNGQEFLNSGTDGALAQQRYAQTPNNRKLVRYPRCTICARSREVPAP